MLGTVTLNTRFNRWLDAHEIAKLFILLAIAAVVVAIAIIGNSPRAIPPVFLFLALIGPLGFSRFCYIRTDFKD